MYIDGDKPPWASPRTRASGCMRRAPCVSRRVLPSCSRYRSLRSVYGSTKSASANTRDPFASGDVMSSVFRTASRRDCPPVVATSRSAGSERPSSLAYAMCSGSIHRRRSAVHPRPVMSRIGALVAASENALRRMESVHARHALSNDTPNPRFAFALSRKGIVRPAHHHGVVVPDDAARAGEARLVVDGDPLVEPAWRVQVREEERVATEHVLRRTPPAGRAVEMEDVRELMGHDEVYPVVEKTQRRRIDRRARVDDDAVRRKDRRIPVRDVEIVADREIDRTARFVQFLREAAVRALDAARGTARDRLESRREVDVKMFGGDRLPVQVGRDLRVRGGGDEEGAEQDRVQRAHCERRPAEEKDRHRLAANERKYSSRPSTIPAAYRF